MGGGDLVVTSGNPEPLGLQCDSTGANIAVFSEHATAIELCLFTGDGQRETARIKLPERSGAVLHGHVSGIRPGQRYGLRAHGPWAPDTGHRFNPAKLLLDPYAKALTGPLVWAPELTGHDSDDDGKPDTTDSARFLPKCIAAQPLPRIDPTERPRIPWSDTTIYEAHTKGLTKLWPGIDQTLRGRIEALGTPEVIAHLTSLGITTVELLPIQAFIDERHLAERGLTNYWGYNSVGFFTVEPRYLGGLGIAGVRDTVRRLHAAGIEVILDVVYNHTGEGDAQGPTLSFRGLDNRSYYHFDPDAPDGYANHTGCGNTLDLSHPFVLRLVLDSMRWWAERVGIDGFRFDLAPAMTRGADGFDPGSGFLGAVLQDPVLRDLKLIAEPWDIGPEGYRPGTFPAPVAEWNDTFRDSVRSFWRGDTGSAKRLADGLLGSARIFDHEGRRPFSSINFVACHDGFTLADMTMYRAKQNAANGEDNRDGHNENLSEDFGVPGPSADPVIAGLRRQRQRNLLATIFLAQGTPMLRAGDEIAQSQGGNNNAYCQDNETSWIDWESGDEDLHVFVRRLLRLRASLPVLRQRSFLHGAIHGDDRLPDVEWLGLDGAPVDWDDPTLTGYALLLRGCADMITDPDPTPVMLALNAGDAPQSFPLRPEPSGRWRRVLDSADPDANPDMPTSPAEIAPHSLAVFAAGDVS